MRDDYKLNTLNHEKNRFSASRLFTSIFDKKYRFRNSFTHSSTHVYVHANAGLTLFPKFFSYILLFYFSVIAIERKCTMLQNPNSFFNQKFYSE